MIWELLQLCGILIEKKNILIDDNQQMYIK